LGSQPGTVHSVVSAAALVVEEDEDAAGVSPARNVKAANAETAQALNAITPLSPVHIAWLDFLSPRNFTTPR
jgi:hypothetical protein